MAWDSLRGQRILAQNQRVRARERVQVRSEIPSTVCPPRLLSGIRMYNRRLMTSKAQRDHDTSATR